MTHVVVLKSSTQAHFLFIASTPRICSKLGNTGSFTTAHYHCSLTRQDPAHFPFLILTSSSIPPHHNLLSLSTLTALADTRRFWNARALLLPWNLCSIILIRTVRSLPARRVDVEKFPIQSFSVPRGNFQNRLRAYVNVQICLLASHVRFQPLHNDFISPDGYSQQRHVRNSLQVLPRRKRSLPSRIL